jgi:hypothetical protein
MVFASHEAYYESVAPEVRPLLASIQPYGTRLGSNLSSQRAASRQRCYVALPLHLGFVA